MSHNIISNFRKKVNQVLGFQSGATGEIAVFDTLNKDFKALEKFYKPVGEWRSLANQTLMSSTNSESTLITMDYLALEHLPKAPHKLFVAPPTNAVLENQPVLRAMRGAICIKHIKDKRRITINLATAIKQMMEGKYPQISKHIDLDQSSVMELQHLHTKPGSDIFKMLSYLLEALKEGFELEDLFSTTSIVVNSVSVVKNNETENIIKPPTPKAIRQPHPIHESGDLLAYLASGLQYATPRDFSGLTTFFTGLQPFELCEYLNCVLDQYRQNKSEVLLAILLTFHIRVGAGHFNLVGFNYEAGNNVWINLDRGHLCWNRLAIVNDLASKETPAETDVFAIPLPSELCVELRIKFASKKGKKLGEIFTTPLAELRKHMRSYAENYTDSSHKPYLTRLARSVGRFYFDLCRDDVYAAALSMDFTISTQSAFHYFVSDPKVVNQICLEAYEKIGYQPILDHEVNHVCGPKLGNSREKLQQLLVSKLNKSIDTFHALHAKSDLNYLVFAHNQIVVGIMILTSSVLGMRRAEEYSICSHTIDLDKNLVVITDKASSEYLTTRLLPIPKQLKIWLEFYFAWLTRLANRLITLAPTLAIQIANTSASNKLKMATSPTFFLIEDEKIVPLGSRHIECFFKEYDLEVNVGRHVFDHELRHLTNSSIVNIFMGHANPGQEGLGLRSALPTYKALAELKLHLEEILEDFELPQPPKIQKAKIDPIRNTKKYEAFRPKLWKVRHG